MRFWILNNIINIHRIKEAAAYLNGDRKKLKVIFRQCSAQVLSPALSSCLSGFGPHELLCRAPGCPLPGDKCVSDKTFWHNSE